MTLVRTQWPRMLRGVLASVVVLSVGVPPYSASR